MIYSYLFVFSLACTVCWAQENYYQPQPAPPQDFGAVPPSNFYEGGQFQAPVSDRRSFQEQPQLITKVFTLPDGTITTLQVPQNFA